MRGRDYRGGGSDVEEVMTEVRGKLKMKVEDISSFSVGTRNTEVLGLS